MTPWSSPSGTFTFTLSEVNTDTQVMPNGRAWVVNAVGQAIFALSVQADGWMPTGRNIFTEAAPYRPVAVSVATLPDGRMAVTWMSVDDGAGTAVVRARILDAGANALTPVIDLGAASWAGFPARIGAISVQPKGADGFVVVAGGQAVTGWELSVTGTVTAGPTALLTGGRGDPALAAFGDGRHVLAWETGGFGSTDITIRFADESLAATVADRTATTTTAGAQTDPALAILADGRVLLAWTDGSATGGDIAGTAIRARLFSAAGTPLGGEFLVNTTTAGDQRNPTVTALRDGGFIIAWNDAPGVARAQVYDAAGARRGTEIAFGSPANPNAPQNVTIDEMPDGRVLVSWWEAFGINIRPFAQIWDPRTAAVEVEGSVLNDTFYGTAWDDSLGGGTGHDVLHGRDGDDLLEGGSGDDGFDGGAGDDILIGGAGNDALDGGTGADIMRGGSGNDGYMVDDLGDLVFEAAGGGTDTVWTALAAFSLAALPAVEVLRGTAATGQSLTGNGLANTIAGADGPDTLDGGAGADSLSGGLGDDAYRVDDAADALLDAGGWDRVIASLDWTLATGFEWLSLSGTADLSGTGNAAANRIDGNAGCNLLSGGGGNDLLRGGAGDDTLDGDAEADRLDGGTGADLLRGGEGDDTYYVDDPGDAVLDAGGADRVVASVDWTLAAGIERLSLSGTAGLAGTGNAEANRIDGNAGANLLRGLAGGDRILGNAGADTLWGGEGSDVLAGGDGADVFLWDSPAEGADRVADFAPGADRIALSAAGFGGGLSAGMDLLAEGRFAANATGIADAAIGQLVYHTGTGTLRWDADGTGAGAAVTIAVLSGLPVLAASDILLVA
jgi:Ca2+-binding RTX toxin-like protein